MDSQPTMRHGLLHIDNRLYYPEYLKNKRKMKGPEPVASNHHIVMRMVPSDSLSQFHDPAYSFAICNSVQSAMPFLALQVAQRHYPQQYTYKINLKSYLLCNF